tara:strand:- start:1937 stop:3142 length:1206 start_codon:yes stop_codon:yes gene_type:complete
MSKKILLKNIFLLGIFSVIFIDISGSFDFNLDKLFYKLDFIFGDLITIIPNLVELNTMDINSAKISSSEKMGRVMNYPLIWVYIFNFVGKLINPVTFFGYSQILFYFIYAYYAQSKVTNIGILIILFCLLFSPPLLLALERGNNDLTIFFLIMIGFLSSSFIRGLLLGIAIALKVYPVFLIIIYFLLNKLNRSFLFGLLLTSPLILFTMLQLNIYIGNTEVSFSGNFGLLTMGLFFQKIITLLLQINMNKILLIFLSVIIFFVSVKALNYFLNDQVSKFLSKLSKNRKNFELFILSTGLSVLIFLTFSSWAYRLVFLLPATIIFIKEFNLSYHFLNFRNFLVFFLLTSPFLSTWVLLQTKELLLNHYTWAVFAPITFFSFSLYFLILKKGIKVYKINFLKR